MMVKVIIQLRNVEKLQLCFSLVKLSIARFLGKLAHFKGL
jgi:hypothetical protein